MLAASCGGESYPTTSTTDAVKTSTSDAGPPRRPTLSSTSCKSTRAPGLEPMSSPQTDSWEPLQHDTFGLGTVVAVVGAADKAVASIDFGSEGVKRLLLRYAPVEKI